MLPHQTDQPADLPADPTARSRRAARFLLLAACAAGLVGLALPGGPAPARVSLAAATASAPTVVVPEPAVRHGVAAAPARPVQRASRSRAAAPKRKATAPRRNVVRWVGPSGAPVGGPFGIPGGPAHKGSDLGAHYGAPIRAIGDGVVVGAGYLAEESGYGQITLIRHSNGVVSAYAHQSRMLVHAGEHVTAGEVIGYVGATGHVTGPHLHFEIRMSTHGGQVDPRAWLRKHGVYV